MTVRPAVCTDPSRFESRSTCFCASCPGQVPQGSASRLPLHHNIQARRTSIVSKILLPLLSSQGSSQLLHASRREIVGTPASCRIASWSAEAAGRALTMATAGCNEAESAIRHKDEEAADWSSAAGRSKITNKRSSGRSASGENAEEADRLAVFFYIKSDFLYHPFQSPSWLSLPFLQPSLVPPLPI